MVEGFWLVQYEAMLGSGGGVVMFVKGKVFGGDSQTTYLGDYEESDNSVSAQVQIHNYVPGVASVVGVEGDYLLNVDGLVEGSTIKATGTPIEHDVAGMALKFTKIAELPK